MAKKVRTSSLITVRSAYMAALHQTPKQPMYCPKRWGIGQLWQEVSHKAEINPSHFKWQADHWWRQMSLKSCQKDTFIVTKNRRKAYENESWSCFFEWGIELNKHIQCVKQWWERCITQIKKDHWGSHCKKYVVPKHPLQQPVKRPMQEQDKPLCNISKTMKGVEKSYDWQNEGLSGYRAFQ